MGAEAVSTVGVHELLTFVAMIVAFCVAAMPLRQPVGIALALGAIVGAVVGGYLFPLPDLARHLVEGMFGYLDPVLTIAAATIFMFLIQENGLLGTLVQGILVTFHKRPVLLLAGVALLIMLPGALTGSSTACVLTTGALLAPVLMALGVPREKTGAVLAMGGVCGMIAPPVNIPALIICAGVDMPYLGLDRTLLALTVPIALITTWTLCLPHCRQIDLQKILADLPPSVHARHGVKLYAPLVLVAFFLVGEHYTPALDWGHPLIFLLGGLTALVTGERVRFFSTSYRAFQTALPVLGILMGVGMFIQIMTLTGARGEFVVQSLRFPRGWSGLYEVIAVSMPVFGAISSFGSASVLGVPFTLALPQGSTVIVVHAAALSLLAGLGDLMPPTAKSALFAAQVVNEPKLGRVLRHCIFPALLTVVLALLFIQFSSTLAPYLVKFR